MRLLSLAPWPQSTVLQQPVCLWTAGSQPNNSRPRTAGSQLRTAGSRPDSFYPRTAGSRPRTAKSRPSISRPKTAGSQPNSSHRRHNQKPRRWWPRNPGSRSRQLKLLGRRHSPGVCTQVFSLTGAFESGFRLRIRIWENADTSLFNGIMLVGWQSMNP